jgi:hypothetical protein
MIPSTEAKCRQVLHLQLTRIGVALAEQVAAQTSDTK